MHLLLSRTMEAESSSSGISRSSPSKRIVCPRRSSLAQRLQFAVAGCGRRSGTRLSWLERISSRCHLAGPRAPAGVLVMTSMPSVDGHTRRRRPELRGLLYLHHADAAGADLVDVLQIAQGGDVDTGRLWRPPAPSCRRERLTSMPLIVRVIIYSMSASLLLLLGRSRRNLHFSMQAPHLMHLCVIDHMGLCWTCAGDRAGRAGAGAQRAALALIRDRSRSGAAPCRRRPGSVFS